MYSTFAHGPISPVVLIPRTCSAHPGSSILEC